MVPLAVFSLSAHAAPPAQCATARDIRLLTEDGATIALHHHARASGPPVILVHGIASNARFFDLDPEHSLAAWLAERGHDVWLLDLRGHGEALYGMDGRRQISGWTVDDYGRYDVAAAVDYVRARGGYHRVGYIGHSMGGMVAAVYLATHPDHHLSSLTVLGSPIQFSMDDPLFGLAQAGFAAGGGATLWVEAPIFADAAAQRLVPRRLKERLYNPENFEPDTITAMLRTIVSPLSRREMQHFARMIRDERFESFDRTVDYRAALATIRVPTLAVVGAADRVAGPEHVRAWGEAMGGETHVLEAGRESGFAADYGHLDFTLGERAATEIFPWVDMWLNQYTPRGGAPTRARPAAPPPP